MLNIENGGTPHFQEAAGSHFPTDLLEIEEVQGSCHFQISKAISMDMKASPACWMPWMPHWGIGRTSNEGPAVVFHSVMFNPSSTLRA
jgi:hypothetical protein